MTVNKVLNTIRLVLEGTRSILECDSLTGRVSAGLGGEKRYKYLRSYRGTWAAGLGQVFLMDECPPKDPHVRTRVPPRKDWAVYSPW